LFDSILLFKDPLTAIIMKINSRSKEDSKNENYFIESILKSKGFFLILIM